MSRARRMKKIRKRDAPVKAVLAILRVTIPRALNRLVCHFVVERLGGRMPRWDEL